MGLQEDSLSSYDWFHWRTTYNELYLRTAYNGETIISWKLSWKTAYNRVGGKFLMDTVGGQLINGCVEVQLIMGS